ncbi:MAG: ferredoxin family protein [Spirochaetes bacterium]|nr:ferredoxin family protein [Spirochaetota bacterium]
MEYLKNVVTLALDPDRCIGCKMCLEVCPHQVFVEANQKVRLAHKDKCIECGACQRNCPAKAISVKAGVGCAAAVYFSFLKGKKEITCGSDCGDDNTSCCC